MRKPTHYRMVEGVILGLDDENRLIGYVKRVNAIQNAQHQFSDALNTRTNKYSKRF